MYVLINFVCMKTDEIKTEIHPLEPFFPQGARLLMMGSFPPKRERWKMDFFTILIFRMTCGVSLDWYFFSTTRSIF